MTELEERGRHMSYLVMFNPNEKFFEMKSLDSDGRVVERRRDWYPIVSKRGFPTREEAEGWIRRQGVTAEVWAQYRVEPEEPT